MSCHKCICCLEIGIFVKAFSRHLIQHGAFQMNDFIMRKNKDIVLRICILHGKCHHMMCIFPEIRIQLHILCKIMHPSHIPLQAESQSVILRVSCNLWPCSGFFCDHHRPRISSKYNRIKMLEKLNRLKILISTILVWNPLSVFTSVVKI